MRTRAYFWILAILSALVLLTPIRVGDLAGYDDALYAHIAKNIVLSGDWLNLTTNGHPALEHPPLLHWMEAALFSLFGISDPVAKLPSALCGFGVVLMTYWLARRLLKTELHAVLAMLAMAGSVYFVKYAARAMTDVPCTFFFLCAICAWVLAERNPRWYLAAGMATALALMSRGMIGFALPAIFFVHSLVVRKWPPVRYAVPALIIALAPLVIWYIYTVQTNGPVFFAQHEKWLSEEVYGPLTPAWRRYTGAFEYVWMVAKSYWPWFPFLIGGLVVVGRGADRERWLLLVWAGAVFSLCAITRSRVLRYMLPAYPAFALLTAVGLARWIPERFLQRGLRILTPLLAAGAFYITLFPPARWHASEVRALVPLLNAAVPDQERIEFFDEGQPRFDELNQLQWYGKRVYRILIGPGALANELRAPRERLFLVDRTAYQRSIRVLRPHTVIAESGHLVFVRLL